MGQTEQLSKEKIDALLAKIPSESAYGSMWSEAKDTIAQLLKTCENLVETNVRLSLEKKAIESVKVDSVTQPNVWNPILTAPKGKDGGALSPYGPMVDLRCGKVRIPECCWDHSKQRWVRVVRYMTKNNRRKTVINYVVNPTHWMQVSMPLF